MINASVVPAKPVAAEIQVGEWRFAPRGNELRRDGERIRLEPKAIEVLAFLAACPGEVVAREELLSAVWPGVVVGDDTLTQAIIKLRKALGDDAHAPRYIETIPKRGYRLVAPVGDEGVRAAAAPAKAPPQSGRRLRVAAAVAGLLVAAVIVVFAIDSWRSGSWPLAADEPSRAAPASMPVVAVMPLENLSGDPKRDYFSEGVTEDINNALGRFSGIRVMSRNSVQALKGAAAPPQAIHKALGARYVVQGSVRQADGRLRVTIELSDAERGTQLWTERYEGEGAQIFEIQDRIAREIVGRLQVKLRQVEQQRVFTRPTESLEAHDLVLRARWLLDREDRGANREARTLLARAAKLAPSYGEILTAQGIAELQRANFGWVEDAAEGMGRAEEYARRALALADHRSHAGAHSLLSGIHGMRGELDAALAEAARAVELNPNDVRAMHRRSQALLHMGRFDESLAVVEGALRIDPYPTGGTGVQVALTYYMVDRYGDALAMTDALLARGPNLEFLHAMRAASLAQLGRVEEARLAARQVRLINPAFVTEILGTRFADPKHTAKVQEGLRKAGL